MTLHSTDFEFFREVRQLGSGTFGSTLLVERNSATEGERRSQKRYFALKIPKVPPELLGGPQEALVLNLLIREAMILTRLHSDHIVRVYDIEVFRGQQAMVMDYVEGMTLLETLIKSPGRRLETPKAVEIAIQIARGLSVAHAIGVVHKDIKPANVMIRAEDGRAVIIDFGIAKIKERLRTGTRFMCTPAYAPPEQLDVAGGRGTSPSADVYSLACVLFEMINGYRPFRRHETDDERMLQAKFECKIEPFRDAVPERLRAVIMTGLQSDHSKRYPSGKELLEALSASVGKSTSAPIPREDSRPDDSSKEAPRTPVEYLDHAHAHIVNQRYREAAECLRAGVRIYPDVPVLHYRLGLALHRCDDSAGAVDQIRAALELWKLSAEAPGVKKQVQIALQYLTRLGHPAEGQRDVSGLLSQVHSFLSQHDYEGAREILQEALDESPANAVLNYALGDVFQRLGQFVAAEACLKRALAGELTQDVRKKALLKLVSIGRHTSGRGRRN